MSDLIKWTSPRLVLATFSPTLAATPDYSANDAMGTGAIELTGLVRDAGGVGRIVGIHSTFDGTTAAPAISLIFFSGNPTTATTTDNDALVIDATAKALVVGVASIGTLANYGGVSIGSSAALNIPFRCASTSTSLWCVAMATGTIDVAAATDLVCRIAVEQA